MKLRALLVLVASVLLAAPLTAQESTESSRGPDGGTRFRVHGIEVLPATERPFSARDSIVWTRNLEDGSKVTTYLYATVARDSQGRIYRERRSFVPANAYEQSRQIELILLDPVAHTRTTCTVKTRRCLITGYHASPSFVPPQDGLLDKGTRYLSRQSLGTGVVDDLNVVGTRETLSISAGAVGNTQPLLATREFWYSPELQVNLSVTRKDPREGTQVLQLVDLSLAEPDPAMFQIPAGFVIQDLRGKSAKPEN
jgi:hypothetical protein